MKFSTTYFLLALLMFFLNVNAIRAQSDDQEIEETAEYTLVENYSFVNPRTDYLKDELEEQAFNEKTWQTVIENYDYTNAREKDRDEAFDVNETNRTQTGSGGNSGFGLSSRFWAGFFKFLLIAAAIITFTFLMLNLMGVGSFFGPINKKIKHQDKQITIENLEDNILESDLDRFIRLATEEKNYALAIRLYYLAIIKELSLKKDIKWKRDKTNKDYLREMRKHPLFNNFRESTAVFERIWYGNIALTEQDYQGVKPKFQKLIQTIQHGGRAKA